MIQELEKWNAIVMTRALLISPTLLQKSITGNLRLKREEP